MKHISAHPAGYELFRRMDHSSQNTIALLVSQGALLQVNHLLGNINAVDFMDEQFGSQMAAYSPGLEEITLRYQ